MLSPFALIDGYLEGLLNDEQFDKLVDWLHADPKNAEAFAVWSQTHQQIEEQYRKQDVMATLDDEAFGPVQVTSKDSDATDLISEASLSDAANDWQQFLSEPLLPGESCEGHSLPYPSTHDLVSLVGYVFGRARTAKPVYKMCAIAAMVVFATMLFVDFGGDDDTATEPLAGQLSPHDIQDYTQRTSTPTVVATLTAERNAVWERQPEQRLYAGQRFKLTQGFAEITTLQGAVVVLQAPCSVEMTGGDNALRLVHGELAARIDTERAKGFTVFLPQNSKLVDLGTAFRVSVDASGRADCLVTEGKVVWQIDEQDDASALIVAGQTAQLVDGQHVVSDAVEVFSENFDSYTSDQENFNGRQYQTGLTVAFKGMLPGWQHMGYTSLHAVDHANRFGRSANPSNYAAMLIYGTLQTAVNGANEAGKAYEVSFLASPAVYQDPAQSSTDDSHLVFELLRHDGTVLATHNYHPGTWSGQLALLPVRFTYRGDGSGELNLRIRSADSVLDDIDSALLARGFDKARYAGAIDDLSIRVVGPATNSTE
jgi:hypothetical protein